MQKDTCSARRFWKLQKGNIPALLPLPHSLPFFRAYIEQTLSVAVLALP
jgi:hypothetical protein